MWIMMRNKFLILTFGLLLAVGWTSSAQAQRLPAKSSTASTAPMTSATLASDPTTGKTS